MLPPSSLPSASRPPRIPPSSSPQYHHRRPAETYLHTEREFRSSSAAGRYVSSAFSSSSRRVSPDCSFLPVTGTDSFFSSLIDTLQHDFSFLSHSLEPLRINPLHRAEAGQALLLSSKSKVSSGFLVASPPFLPDLTLHLSLRVFSTLSSLPVPPSTPSPSSDRRNTPSIRPIFISYSISFDPLLPFDKSTTSPGCRYVYRNSIRRDSCMCT